MWFIDTPYQPFIFHSETLQQEQRACQLQHFTKHRYYQRYGAQYENMTKGEYCELIGLTHYMYPLHLNTIAT